MTLKTNLKGRLKNTTLSYSKALMPLFDAVVNSIHAIEEAGVSAENGEITVYIVRDGQTSLSLEQSSKKPGRESELDIVGFKIEDNGIGFNDENMASFEELDSEHKAEKGCRGVGRLLWLKAFDSVEITSTYRNENKIKRRNFTFSVDKGVSQPAVSEETDNCPIQTIVHLKGFKPNYQKSAKKTAASIAFEIFEHNLWYFVRPGGVPKIKLIDSDTVIYLDNVFEENIRSTTATESIEIKGQKFELTHIKRRSSSLSTNSVAYCAASRLVKEENIAGKIPGLFGKLKDDTGDFVYACYVSSHFLDDRVRSERTGFNVEEEIEGLLERTDISWKDIRSAVFESVASHLSSFISANKIEAKERVTSYVSNKAPRYRPILSRLSEEDMQIDPDISDKDLDIKLHVVLSDIERSLLEEGNEILNLKENETDEKYRERIDDYMSRVKDLKKSDLANYVAHRRVILDIFEQAMKRKDDGKFNREEILHSLIMPMKIDSNEINPDGCNLWLLDERLAFHDYLASDKPLSSFPVTGTSSTKEPDIFAINVYDNPILVSERENLPLASIVVVEIKRPMRNDARAGEDKDPVEQAIGYLRRVREGGVTTAAGRPISNPPDIAGFCYVVCDITPSVKSRCEMLSLTPTADRMGYFGYNPNFKAYIEVNSFDRILEASKQRNRAFFDKLGLPVS